jgi:alcohol dehydrogenase
LLNERDIQATIFAGAKPNPTIANVEAGLAVLQEKKCDLSSRWAAARRMTVPRALRWWPPMAEDCRLRRGGSLEKTATAAGGHQYHRRHGQRDDPLLHHHRRSAPRENGHCRPQCHPILSVNDPDLMIAKPKGLTAATGMDALTHAIEAYVSTAATPITDACALKAVALIAQYLRTAVENGKNLEAREQMAYAEFLAGMAFNNASLGYVHAMAHQLGGVYDLPHGVCNALLLPHVEAFNVQTSAARLADVAAAMG